MTEIDIGLGVLDHQLVDCDGRRCGKADDLELEGMREGKPRVSAIVVGVPAWRGRGALARLGAALSRGRAVHVPWSEVEEVASGIHLKHSAAELRLGRGDDRAARLVGRLPNAR
jgi:sporulation protein YlmC with PRC-barrel domain